MSYETQPTLGRRIGRSIVWILSTALIIFVLIAVIGAIGWGAFLGFEELRRSFDAIAVRDDIQERRIELLRSDVDNLMADSGRLNSLQSELNDLEGRLDSAQERLAADLSRQQEMLGALAEDVATVEDASSALAEDTMALSGALSALQADITDNSQRLDELGGELDELRPAVSTLGSNLSELQAAAAARAEDEMTETRQVLALFHVWELISRARLRLLENNFGLAQTDIEQAVRAMDLLMAAAPAEEMEAWQRVQIRLGLALTSLPADPARSAADLESAWDTLDEVLALMLLPQLEAPESLPDGTADAASAVEATAEVTPTPTAIASPTATALATATPIPTAISSPTPAPTPTP